MKKTKILALAFSTFLGIASMVGATLWNINSAVASAETSANVIELGDTLVKSVSPTDESVIYATQQTNNDGVNRLAESDYVEYAVGYTSNVREIYVFVNATGNFILSVSDDHQGYTAVVNDEADSFGADYVDGNSYYYDLAEYLTGENTTYVRFTAKEDGCVINGLAFSARKEYQAYEVQDGVDCEVQYTVAMNSDLLLEKDFQYDNAFGYVFCDMQNTLTYRFPLKKATTVGLEVVVYAHAGYRISVSGDNETWKDLDISELKYYCYDSSYYNDGGNYDSYAFDVSYLLEEEIECVYVRLGDSSSWTGFGGQYDWIALKEFYPTSDSKLSVVENDKLVSEVQLSADRYLEENNGSIADGVWRKIEGDDYFVYRLDLPETTTSLSVAMSISSALDLYLSYDGENYLRLPKSTFVSGSEYFDGTSYSANLTPYLADGKTVYLKFCDGNPDDGEYFILKRFFVLHNDSSLENRNEKYYETEQYSVFTDINVDEQDYLQYKSKHATQDRFLRVLDRSYAIYKFDYKAGYDGLKLVGVLRGSYYLQISFDGTTWQDVAVCDTPVVQGSANASRELYTDLSEQVNLNKNGSIWVKVSDVVDDNGFGGQIKGLGILQYSGAEREFEVNEKELPVADLTTVAGDSPSGCGSTLDSTWFSVLIVAAGALLVFKGVGKNED